MSRLSKRLRSHALPDPNDEREVLHAPLLREAANEIDRLREALQTVVTLLGPNVPKDLTCQGCAYEWGRALNEARNALIELVGQNDT